MLKRLAAAGAVTAAMGGILLTASPALAGGHSGYCPRTIIKNTNANVNRSNSESDADADTGTEATGLLGLL